MLIKKTIGVDDIFLNSNHDVMNEKNMAQTFLSQYKNIYQNLHTFWEKGETYPSPESLAVMNHLTRSGPLTVAEAARHFGRSQSAMSELFDRLQVRGYVSRIKDQRDKRKRLIWLTKNGRAVFKKTQEVLDIGQLEASLNVLSEAQREQLFNGMESLVLASKQIVSNNISKEESSLESDE